MPDEPTWPTGTLCFTARPLVPSAPRLPLHLAAPEHVAGPSPCDTLRRERRVGSPVDSDRHLQSRGPCVTLSPDSATTHPGSRREEGGLGPLLRYRLRLRAERLIRAVALLSQQVPLRPQARSRLREWRRLHQHDE